MKSGVVVVNKPAGMTSHDVVNRCRRIFHTKQVGHTGTLDPDATGVLPICIGSATRLAEYLTAEDKNYRVSFIFGENRDTQDASGQVIERAALPTADKAAFLKVLEGFIGPLDQEVPVYSAVKIDGEPLYRLAREGRLPAKLPKRQIHIRALECLAYDGRSAELLVTCSKGTYIRTLCLDIAKAMDSLAYVSRLERTASGAYLLDDAVSLEELAEAADPEAYLTSPAKAMERFPTLQLSPEDAGRIRLGQAIDADRSLHAEIAIALEKGRLLAVGRAAECRFKPKKVFMQEDKPL